MKINKKELLTAVNVCGIIKNDSVPIWDYLLIQCVNGEILITGRNSKNIIHYRIKDESGSTINPFLIKATMLIKLLKECPDDMVIIASNDNRVVISFDHSTFDISHSGSDATDYIDSLPNCGELKASAGIPVRYITESAKAWSTFAGEGDIRPILNYISLELTDGEGSLVTTDTKKLIRVKFEWHTKEPQTFLLPGKVIGKLCKLMPKQDIQIRSFTKDWMEIEVGSIGLLYYVPSDRYPNWKTVIPESSYKLKFNTNEFRTAVKQVHLITNTSTHQLILESNENGTFIHTHDFDEDNRAKVQIKAERLGEPIKIGLNSVLLQDCLSVIKGTTTTMEYTTANMAVVFTGDGSKEVLVLLMTVMLNE